MLYEGNINGTSKKDEERKAYMAEGKVEQYLGSRVHIVGEVESDIVLDHVSFGKEFYSVMMSVKRDSGTSDLIYVIIPHDLIKDTDVPKKGEIYELFGQIRSYNRHNRMPKLVVYVFANSIKKIDDVNAKHVNDISLTGRILINPVYRLTPLKRHITDLFLGINRYEYKIYKVPCIAWGGNAYLSSEFKCGDVLKISGRIQSREFSKIDKDGDTHTYIASEVSISSMEKKN